MIRVTFNPGDLQKVAKVSRKLRQVVTAANIDLWNDLVDGTPVDTGAARAYWWPALEGDPPTHPSPPNAASGSVGRPEAAPMALLQSAGRKLSINNGAAYIRRLEYQGWSSQAPNGWIRAAAARYPVHIKRRVAEATGSG